MQLVMREELNWKMKSVERDFTIKECYRIWWPLQTRYNFSNTILFLPPFFLGEKNQKAYEVEVFIFHKISRVCSNEKKITKFYILFFPLTWILEMKKKMTKLLLDAYALHKKLYKKLRPRFTMNSTILFSRHFYFHIPSITKIKPARISFDCKCSG